MGKSGKISESSKGIENITLDQFVELVMEVDLEDPIDFGMVLIKEKDAFRITSRGVLDLMRECENPEERELILACALAKSLTENMILQIQKLQDLHGITLKNEHFPKK